jgi:hypothetical protein
VHRQKVECDLSDWFVFRPEIREWLDANVGHKYHYKRDENLASWYHDIPLYAEHVFIYFKNPDHAMLFKLTWL